MFGMALAAAKFLGIVCLARISAAKEHMGLIAETQRGRGIVAAFAAHVLDRRPDRVAEGALGADWSVWRHNGSG